MTEAPRLRRPAAEGTATPFNVLLLHGMGGGVNGWDALDPLLADRMQLWDVALPWSTTGDTSWAREWDVTPWVGEAIDAAEIRAGAPMDLVVAHSYAANVLLELIDAHGPHWPRPTVLVSPFYRAEPADFQWEVISYYTEGFRRMLDDGLRLRAGTRIDEEIRKDMAVRLRDLMGPYTWLRFFDIFLRTPLLRLEHLDAPTLVVGGSEDEGALADGALKLAARLPGATVEIFPGCGHFPMIECPRELASAINHFVTTLGPPQDPGARPRHLLEK